MADHEPGGDGQLDRKISIPAGVLMPASQQPFHVGTALSQKAHMRDFMDVMTTATGDGDGRAAEGKQFGSNATEHQLRHHELYLGFTALLEGKMEGFLEEEGITNEVSC